MQILGANLEPVLEQVPFGDRICKPQTGEVIYRILILEEVLEICLPDDLLGH